MDLKGSLDLLDESRILASKKLLGYQTQLARHYNRNVRSREVKVGDLVLQNLAATYQGHELKRVRGKLAPKWEGPYKIEEDHGFGTYNLAYRKAREWRKLNNKWNIANLRCYYV